MDHYSSNLFSGYCFTNAYLSCTGYYPFIHFQITIGKRDPEWKLLSIVDLFFIGDQKKKHPSAP
jgi:hypothetical protein